MRKDSRGSKEEGSFFEQKDDSFMSNNSVRSRNRMRQRSMSKKSKSRREPSVKLDFTPKKKKRTNNFGSKKASPFGHMPPVLGKSNKDWGESSLRSGKIKKNFEDNYIRRSHNSKKNIDNVQKIKPSKPIKINNPMKMLTKLKSDPEILKDVIPDLRQHQSELREKRGSYYEARNNNKSMKLRQNQDIIRKKSQNIPDDSLNFNLESESDNPESYMGSVNNMPKRNSYQSFGEIQNDKNNKRYPTFGTKDATVNKRLHDFQKKRVTKIKII